MRAYSDQEYDLMPVSLLKTVDLSASVINGSSSEQESADVPKTRRVRKYVILFFISLSF